MPKIAYINLDAASPSQGFVKSFTEISEADPLVFTADDKYNFQLRFLKLNTIPTPGQPFFYVDPSGWASVKFAGGYINQTPNGGTFTLTSSLGGTTGAIAYNAAAATTVQTAIQGLTGLSAATVTGNAGGPYSVDSNQTTNGSLAITGSAVALAPDGSTVVIVKTQTANGSLTNRWQISLAKALPLLKTTGWTALPSPLVTTAVVQAGSAIANKVFNVTWNGDAIGGSVYLSFTGDSVTETIGPIAFNAGPQDVVSAFEAHTDVEPAAVSVIQNGLGNYTIACVGPGIRLSNTPALATSSNTLQVPLGLQGVLTASTAGFDSILNGATSIDNAVIEVEITESAGEPYTAAQIANGVFLQDLIPNNPGQSTGLEDWATIGDVERIAPHTFANNAARIADVPDHDGQFGYQLDDDTWWVSGSTTAGDWNSVVSASNIISGLVGAIPGLFTLYNAAHTFNVGITVSTLTGDRTLTAPDASGVIAIQGGADPYVAKTGTYAIANTDGTINCTANTFTVTLPTAVGISGKVFNIKNSGAGTITVATTGGQTVDGGSAPSVTPGVNLTLQSTGANWILL